MGAKLSEESLQVVGAEKSLLWTGRQYLFLPPLSLYSLNGYMDWCEEHPNCVWRKYV